jgi:hypothetical protein
MEKIVMITKQEIGIVIRELGKMPVDTYPLQFILKQVESRIEDYFNRE